MILEKSPGVSPRYVRGCLVSICTPQVPNEQVAGCPVRAYKRSILVRMTETERTKPSGSRMVPSISVRSPFRRLSKRDNNCSGIFSARFQTAAPPRRLESYHNGCCTRRPILDQRRNAVKKTHEAIAKWCFVTYVAITVCVLWSSTLSSRFVGDSLRMSRLASFPSPAWELVAREAPPRRSVQQSFTVVRPQAELGNEAKQEEGGGMPVGMRSACADLRFHFSPPPTGSCAFARQSRPSNAPPCPARNSPRSPQRCFALSRRTSI